MEKVKAQLPPDHTAIVFNFSQERSSRKKKKPDDYKQEFVKFRQCLERAKQEDEKKK